LALRHPALSNKALQRLRAAAERHTVDMERPRKFYYWPSGLFFLVVASVAVEMKRRVSGRRQALSTVIKLISEGLS